MFAASPPFVVMTAAAVPAPAVVGAGTGELLQLGSISASWFRYPRPSLVYGSWGVLVLLAVSREVGQSERERITAAAHERDLERRTAADFTYVLVKRLRRWYLTYV